MQSTPSYREILVIGSFGSLYGHHVVSPRLLPSLLQPVGLHWPRPPRILPLGSPTQGPKVPPITTTSIASTSIPLLIHQDALPPSPPVDTRVKATLDVASEKLVQPSAPPVVDSPQVHDIFMVRIFVDALFYILLVEFI